MSRATVTDEAILTVANAQPAARASTAHVVVGLLRLPEWAKNLFVAAPLIFSGRLLDAHGAWQTALVAGALCAISSSIYVFNDVLDAARDREHPVKRHRPIAAGLISRGAALVIAAGLLGLGLMIVGAAQAPGLVMILAVAFVALNAAYSLYLKGKVIVDILTIAVGYVLRVLIGGAILGIRVTNWLLLCTFLLATFLGFSKRRHELVTLRANSQRHRPVLTLYSEQFLDQMSLLTLAMTLTCYVLYTIAPETIARFGTDALIYSSLIVMFALFRYLFLIHVKQLGSPAEILYKDRQIVLAVVAWMLYIVLIVYTYPAIAGARA